MLKKFEYHRPSNLKDACRLLSELPEAQILAGGTDLLVDLETGLRQAQHVISLKGISELKQIQKDSNRVIIGAACTARNIELSPMVQRHFPELTAMVVQFASPQIRTRATIGGNICSAVACGDFPVILMALGAAVELLSQKGKRTVALKDFFIHNRETIKEESEILSRIIVPKKSPDTAACFQKFRRRASNSLAVASVASFLDLHNGICHTARIVLGAVAPTPFLANKAGASLIGKEVDEEAISMAAELARKEAQPISDVRSSAEFRRELVYVLTKRALKIAAMQAAKE